MRWLFLGLIGGALLVSRADARELDLSYTIYFGGFSVAAFDSKIAVDRSAYRVTTNARSLGVLDYFFPIEVTSEGTGKVTDYGVKPETFSSTGTFNGEPRRIALTSRDGAVPSVVMHPPRDPEKRDAVPEDLQHGTIDPYAAVISLALTAKLNPCEEELQVFNGRTRTDFRISHVGSDILNKSEYSIFDGPAELCEVEYETLAGGYKKSWFGKDKDNTVTRLWVARLTEGGAWVPVRLESEGPFGMIVGHITGANERIDLAKQGSSKSF